MADLTDDQKKQLREAARLANIAVSNGAIDDLDDNDVVVIEPVVTALPALLDENDRLREENRTLGKLAALLRQQRDGLAQTVRAEAYGLEGLPHSSRPDMLAQLADRLHQACARAGGQH